MDPVQVRTGRRGSRRVLALGVGTLLVAGVGVVAVGVAGAPQASADASLQPFSGCEELLDWYRDATLPHVTAYGLGGDGAGFPQVAVAEEAMAASDSAGGAAVAARDGAAATGDAVGSSDTGTNVQEAGVDEPSRIKVSDGVAWTLAGNRLVAVDPVAGDVLGEVDLAPAAAPDGAAAPGPDGSDASWDGMVMAPERSFSELLLSDGRVVVLGSASLPADGDDGSTSSGGAADLTMPGWGPLWGSPTTTATTVDVSDPSSPTVLDRVEVEGGYVSARASGGDVRLVTTTSPQLPLVDPWRVQQERLETGETGGLAEPDEQDEAEALARNEQAVRDATASDWLPDLVQRDASGAVLARTPVDCASVAHPGTQAGAGTVTVLTLDPAEAPTLTGTTSVSADGSLVYASTDRLYVATTRGGWLWGGDQEQTRTDLHGFTTGEPGRTDYLGSGSVEGWLLGSWAMDAHDGHLRVGTTSTSPLGAAGGAEDGVSRPGPVGSTSSSVVVLREGPADPASPEALAEVGRVDGLGPGEQIRSLRWFDDLAVVVTFEQTDPLYTVDLSDVTAPQVVGELKVLGYSGYLHPVGDGMLLGVGQDGTADGVLLGAKVETYDVTDLAAPTDLATLTWPDSSSAVEWDSRLFAYLPGSRTAVLPLERYEADRYSNGLVAVRVDEDGGVTETGAWETAGGGWTSGLATTDELVLVTAETYDADGVGRPVLTVLAADGLRLLAEVPLDRL